MTSEDIKQHYLTWDFSGEKKNDWQSAEEEGSKENDRQGAGARNGENEYVHKKIKK